MEGAGKKLLVRAGQPWGEILRSSACVMLVCPLTFSPKSMF